MSKASTSAKSAGRDAPPTSADRGGSTPATSGSAERGADTDTSKDQARTGSAGSAKGRSGEPADRVAHATKQGSKRGPDAAGRSAAAGRPKPWQPVAGAFGRAWRSLAATRVAVGVLALILAGALGAGGYAGWKHYQHRQDERARKAAVAAATTTVTNFMSISTKTVDHDLRRVLSGATGDFRTQFKNGMGQTKAAVVENKVTAKAHVLSAGVVTSKRRSATVLVAMDATIKNTNAPKGRLAHYRVKVTMAEQNGTWLVSKLQFV
jgi:Mce-associated membrane protein